MHVTLVHNPEAGHGRHSKDDLMGVLQRAGYEVTYYAASGGIKNELRRTTSLIVIAGGDGTVRQVAEVLVGSTTPMAILPMGTANNLAHSLGWEGDVEAIVAGWADAGTRAFDAGAAKGPWGTTWFFEGGGVGLFAEAMPEVSQRKKREIVFFRGPDDELRYDAGGFREALTSFPKKHWHITLDGEDLSGTYVMIEAMNIGRLGPGLCLSPCADPSDGLLDVVLVADKERERLQHYLDYLSDEHKSGMEPPALHIKRGRQLEIEFSDNAVHMDDHVWTGSGRRGASMTVQFTVEPGSVQFLSPRV